MDLGEVMEKYTDRCLEDNNWIIKKIVNEKSNQILKWGIQTHTSFEWLTYTAEELGELAKAIGEYEYRDGRKDDIVREAVQVATLALTIAEIFEKEGKAKWLK
jgi:NTP pyrophosphatase (non-canonical NTP hydrolase)